LPILKEGELNLMTSSALQTHKLGVCFGTLLRAGDVICLSGDLGAGKTVFSAGVGAGWGAHDPLTSPTFNLVHQHQRERDDQTLYHIDCYRLKSAAEIDSIGFEDMLGAGGVVLLEWAEMIWAALPKDHLWIEVRVLDATRRNLIFQAHGARYRALIDDFIGMT
jgi:tRNA threonylcarbamoyladenosine biosynthesis protein TsaE